MKPTVKLVITLLSIHAAFWHLAPRPIHAKSLGLAPAWSFGSLIQEQKLTAADTAAGDQFGRVVALSGDTAIVGAFNESNSRGSAAGAAYVFVRSSGIWTQQQKLIASDGAANDNFGHSVAIDGDTALIGAVSDDNSRGQNAGSVYVFTRTGGVWTEQQRLQASDGALNDGFGYSVSLSGDTTVISSTGDDNGGLQAGSAYIFTRSSGVWTEQQRIQAGDAKAGANFGHSTSLNNDTIIIGAWQDNNSGGTAAGAAYTFIRSGSVWTQQQKLIASDPGTNDFFGTSVSLGGDTAIVGSSLNDGNDTDAGAAYVFTRSGGIWTQQQRLHSSDFASGDNFGSAVSLSEDTAIVTAYLDNANSGTGAGSAYIFARNASVWTQQQKLVASDGAANDHFGLALAMSGSTMIIGAPDDDHSGATDAGSAYIFVPEILNIPPVADAGPDQTATENAPFNLVASFTDPDINDTHTATVNWGDGSPTQAATVTEPSGSNPGTLSASHTYLASGSYQITVTVTDAANAPASDTLQVNVVDPVSDNYIHNSIAQQANANFNISGNGVVGGNLLVNGTLQANGSALTDLNATNITTGTIDNARLGQIPSANIAAGAVTAEKIASNQVVKTLNGLTDNVSLTAGANVTITPSGNNLTISAAGGNFIFNSTTQQPGSNFNISGDGVAANFTAGGTVNGNIINATSQFNLAGNRVLSMPGINNLFAGNGTGAANTTGYSNTLIGYNAGNANTTGSGNFFAGTNAGLKNTTGDRNLFAGHDAGNNTTTGYNNSFIGAFSGGTNTTGIANTLIGAFANVGSNNLFFATAIGSEATVSTSNTIVLGRANGFDKVRIFGLGSGGSGHLCRNSNNEISTCSSSLRYKTNVASFQFGLNLVRRLYPIRFEWKNGGQKDVGFGAEDVAMIEPLLVTYNTEGKVEGVKYDRITAVLVNAIKEQQAQIEAQQIQLKQQQSLINDLRKLFCQQTPKANVCR